MKKVVYSIRKARGNSDYKLSGLGFLNDEGTLFCKCISKSGKQYTRAFDDVGKNCHKILLQQRENKSQNENEPGSIPSPLANNLILNFVQTFGFTSKSHPHFILHSLDVTTE